MHAEVAAIVANPAAFMDDPMRGEFMPKLVKMAPSGERPED